MPSFVSSPVRTSTSGMVPTGMPRLRSAWGARRQGLLTAVATLALLAVLGGCATPPGAWGVSEDPLGVLQEPDPGYEEELATLVATMVAPEEEPGEAPGLREAFLLRLPERGDPQEGPEAEAAAAAPDEKGWAFGAGLFIFVPSLDGHVTVRGNKAEVDLSVYDFGKVVVENFSFAAMTTLEARYEDFFIQLGFIYLGLSDDAKIKTPILTIDIDLDVHIVILQPWLGYRFLDAPLGDEGDVPRLELSALLGGTLYYAKLEIDGSFPIGDREGSQTWFEPSVGLSADLAFTETLSFRALGYIGSFGLSSDLGWGLRALLAWHPSESFTLSAGWLILDSDYDDGNGDDEFEWDIRLSGPSIAFQWTF